MSTRVNKRHEAATVKNGHTPTACAHETLPPERRGRDGDSRPAHPRGILDTISWVIAMSSPSRRAHAMSNHCVERCCTLALALHAGTSITCLVRAGRDRAARGSGSRSTMRRSIATGMLHAVSATGVDAATEAAAAGPSNATTHQGVAAYHRPRRWRGPMAAAITRTRPTAMKNWTCSAACPAR